MRTLLRAALALLLATALVAAAIRYVFPGIALSIGLDFERAKAGLVERSVVLPDGTRIAYLEGGRGDPLVLLHGFGADKDNFTPIAPFLVGQYRIVVPDLPGFGSSSHDAAADHSPLAQAARMSAFCRAIGIARAHVGGNSMGGQIALTWAAARPAEVQSLWLLDPAGIWSAPDSELAKKYRGTGRNPLMVSSEEEFDALISLATTTRPTNVPRFLQDVMARRRIANRPLEERIFKQIAADSIEARIAGLKQSTLIVFGAQDRVIDPATATILHGLLPRSHVVLMPGVGHLPMIEQPAAAASDYIRFRDSM